MTSILTDTGDHPTSKLGFMITLEFSEAKSDADIMVEFWMLRASRVLRGRLGEVESLLHLLLSRDPNAYTTLVSHCESRATV